MKRFQFVKAPHVAARMRALGMKEVEGVKLPKQHCAVFELTREELKTFHALCKGHGWVRTVKVDKVETEAHGKVFFSFTWSPNPLDDGLRVRSGWIRWTAETESGLDLEVPHQSPLSLESLVIKNINDVKAHIMRFHSKSRVEDSTGCPTGEFDSRMGDKTYGLGVTALPKKDRPYAIFIRNF